ncbi:hypothetical protein [Halalkalibacterium ligniniphilum]|uniref:hypothetical protein n=1 Tax=Halalkalibacterium ligniniphilum TaxID=1134413 RepID=UPI0003472D5F|nr:hypothetical protein [Halalkalibacterium ligniniphilum]
MKDLAKSQVLFIRNGAELEYRRWESTELTPLLLKVVQKDFAGEETLKHDAAK